jgi:hypothetical protein
MRLDEEVEEPFSGDGVSTARSAAAFGRFARVPFGAIRDKRIRFTTLKVLVALGERADASGACYPSVATLANDCASSRRTVQRGLRVLEKAGYVSVIRGGMFGGRAARGPLHAHFPPRPSNGRGV